MELSRPGLLGLVLLLLLAVLVGCSDGGSGDALEVVDDVTDQEPDSDELVLPSLTAQLAHWSKTGVFTAAADCGQCHTASVAGADPAVMRAPDPLVSQNQPSPSGEDISPFYDWTSSVMANAFTDPYFRAVMKHETETFPHLAEFIEDTCLTCHTPMARTHAHQTGVDLLQGDSCLLPDGCYPADQAVEDPHAREGISCTACHQITDAVMDGDIHSGNYEIVDESHIDALKIYGPYQNPFGQAMQNVVGYTPEFSEHIADSAHCGSCHELYTPTIDMDTDQPNGAEFPEQTPYTEWLNSALGPNGSNTSCQQCHMARAEVPETYLTRIAVAANGTVNLNWPERTPYFPHVMVGGNTWLLDTLEMFREELGRASINEEGEFAATAELTRNMLQTAADLIPSGQSLSGAGLAFDLTIQNKAGHKIPTSFPSRRMWVATQVSDNTGSVLFSSGFPDASHHLAFDGQFTSDTCLAPKKATGFDSSACFQPHVNEVSSPADIPVYEVVLGSTTDAITHVLLYASEPLKDNRIPPVGFDSAAVPGIVQPAGVDGDANFNAGASGNDTIAYRIAIPEGAVPPLMVETTLYYQTIRPTFVEAVHGEHRWIDEFHGVATRNPPKAEVMATATFSVQ